MQLDPVQQQNMKRWEGKVVAIKYGGNAMVNEELKRQVMEDVAQLWRMGVKVVLVHGGGPEITGLLNRLGKEAVFINGLRVTDQETVDVVLMALAGKVNKTLVNLLELQGAKAMGICGLDGHMMQARQVDERLGFVGDVAVMNPGPVRDLLQCGYVPVIATVGWDAAGNIYNINADTAAAYVAGAMEAECFISMTDIAGILKDKNDPDSLIRVLDRKDAEGLKAKGVIGGGMIPKVDCCLTALSQGVKQVYVIDGRVPHAVLEQLAGGSCTGTLVVEEK